MRSIVILLILCFTLAQHHSLHDIHKNHFVIRGIRATGDQCFKNSTGSSVTGTIINEGGVEYRYFVSNGCPSYDWTGVNFTPNIPLQYVNSVKIRTTPILNTEVTFIGVKSDTGAALSGIGGALGIAINGVSIFGNADSQSRDAYVYEKASFDRCQGHAQQQGVYHYHTEPGKGCVYNDTVGQHSPLFGFMYDSIPIFGVLGDNGNVPTDLDICNGHVDATYPFYHYHVTYNMTYPYIINCLKGCVDTAQFSGPLSQSAKACVPQAQQYNYDSIKYKMITSDATTTASPTGMPPGTPTPTGTMPPSGSPMPPPSGGPTPTGSMPPSGSPMPPPTGSPMPPPSGSPMPPPSGAPTPTGSMPPPSGSPMPTGTMPPPSGSPMPPPSGSPMPTGTMPPPTGSPMPPPSGSPMPTGTMPPPTGSPMPPPSGSPMPPPSGSPMPTGTMPPPSGSPMPPQTGSPTGTMPPGPPPTPTGTMPSQTPTGTMAPQPTPSSAPTTTTTTLAPTTTVAPTAAVVVKIDVVANATVSGNAALIPAPVNSNAVVMYASVGANSTINVAPSETKVPTGGKITGATLTFEVLRVSATVDIKITAYDAATKKILGTKIITVNSAGSISADISSLFSSARNLRQVVVDGKQVTFGIDAVTQGVAVEMSKSTSVSVTYTTTATPTTTKIVLASANGLTVSIASILFAFIALLCM